MTNAGDEGVECGADDCGESLAVMKQCTRCRSIFYVSPPALSSLSLSLCRSRLGVMTWTADACLLAL